MCPFCADRFFVSNTVLCGLWPYSIGAWGDFFDCFLRKLFLTISPGKIKEGARRPRLWRFKGKAIQGKGAAPAGAFRSATERSEALSAEINRNPPFPWCVFGYFLHKQKVTEVPGREALGDEGIIYTAIKSKTKCNIPLKKKKGGLGGICPPKKGARGQRPRKLLKSVSSG